MTFKIVQVVYLSPYDYHRVPWFLSLALHILLESVQVSLAIRLKFLYSLFAFHFFHGIICGYGMKEILEWWKNRIESIPLDYASSFSVLSILQPE